MSTILAYNFDNFLICLGNCVVTSSVIGSRSAEEKSPSPSDVTLGHILQYTGSHNAHDDTA